MVDMLGYPADQLVGREVDEVMAPRGNDGERLLAGGWHRSSRLRSVTRIPEHEVRLRAADGTEVRVMLTGRYERGADGGILGAVLVLRDGARRRQAAAQGIEVISTVSHELRSPLTSVKGYTSLLLNRWDRLADEQKLMMLEQVHHDADRVTRLVTELLDISRLESGRLVLRRQMVDLAQLVVVVVEKVRMIEADVLAEVDFDENFPRVYADPDKIEQVLTNLVENAAKYADPKGVRVQGRIGPGRRGVGGRRRPGRGHPRGRPAPGVHQVLPAGRDPSVGVGTGPVDQPGAGGSPRRPPGGGVGGGRGVGLPLHPADGRPGGAPMRSAS